MAENQIPSYQFSQASEDGIHAYMIPYLRTLNKSIRLQWKEKFHQIFHMYVFMTSLAIFLTFYALVLTRMFICETEDYGPRNNQDLALHLDSYSLIDFKVMDNRIVANWTARFMFINRNYDAEISIQPFDLLVFYQRKYLISCASVAEPLVLKTKYQYVVVFELSPKGCIEEISSDEVMERLSEDIKKGKMSVNLNLGLKATNRANKWGYGVDILDPGCGLDMEFNSTKLLSDRCYSGTLTKSCRIPLPFRLISKS